jgi:hypothetical protein
MNLMKRDSRDSRSTRGWGKIVMTISAISILLLALPVFFLDHHSNTKLRSTIHHLDPEIPSFISKNSGPPICKCPGSSAEAFHNAMNKASSTTFLDIRKPRRPFHSNHWFHTGEYFTSQHSHLGLKNIIKNGDTILFMAPYASFARQLTKMTMFLILIGLSPDGSAKRLEVYEPAWIHRENNKYGNSWGSFESYGHHLYMNLKQKINQQNLYHFHYNIVLI